MTQSDNIGLQAAPAAYFRVLPKSIQDFLLAGILIFFVLVVVWGPWAALQDFRLPDTVVLFLGASVISAPLGWQIMTNSRYCWGFLLGLVLFFASLIPMGVATYLFCIV